MSPTNPASPTNSARPTNSAIANLSRVDAQARSAAVAPGVLEVHLDLSGAADADQAWFGTRSTLRVTALEPETFVDFLGEVHQVSIDGAWTEVDFDGARVWLHDLPIDSEVTVEITGRARYSRTGQGLHRFVDPVDDTTYLYTHFEPSDARRVFATFDQPDLKQKVSMQVVAPAGWTVLANGAARSSTTLDERTTHSFDTTPPLSSYLVAVAAGPWHTASDEWLSEDGMVVPLGLACRASRASTLDAEAIFTVMRQGLDFFDEHMGHPYPWGKYEQVFVPEYNLGAMENPGLVTFTERVLFRTAATRAQYSSRANVVLHEMSHMWFGDLVTPQWWDDLWLKESFAEFMGTHAAVTATEFTDNWVAFAGRRKAWAYQQDELPTTHPIIADIADVEAARQNFDGITYAKGAAVLKQLVHHVGLQAFLAGSRRLFAQRAFSSATFADLVAALETESGRDLSSWVQAWLRTSGPDLLRPVVEVEQGRIVRFAVEQTSVDALTGEHVGRPHTLRVALYDVIDDRLVLRESVPLELAGDGASLTRLVGRPAPALVLVNADDLTYAKVEFDEASLATLREHLSSLDDPLARALVWTNLQTRVRDARLRVDDFLEVVVRHARAESDTASLASLLAEASSMIENYLPTERRAAARLRLAEALSAWVSPGEEPADDRAVVLDRAWALAMARTPELVTRVQDALETTTNVELRWSMLRALAVHGRIDADGLQAHMEAHDDTLDGRTELLGARSGLPDPQGKAELFDTLLTPGALTNAQVGAALAGWGQPLHRDLVAGFDDRYFLSLVTIWDEHPQEIAGRLVEELFPADAKVGATRGRTWLDEHPDAPAALRRTVVELVDQAERAGRAQAFNA
ncbi:aminopeptidase N [Aestuariimicrobium ganziense]|uniref:aminopeptidase N n=1 Tax=Aestuariimicrobium ganziense TaxID=2773677 RepID=UPI001940FC9C|nr:aminopeptidase N [Aestuariimicrobium ganziense]